MAHHLDENGLLYLWNKIKNSFVAKVSGKGLSTNDFTNAEKQKLEGIETGANKYTHPTTHSPSIIAQDANNRFVTDAQIENWNNKGNELKAGTNITISNGTISAKDTTYDVATTSKDGLFSKDDKVKLNAFGDASTYALKSEITSTYKYKGSVTNASDLPSNASTGDVYNIVNASSYGGAGMNVAWDGTKWDALGEMFTITSISNAEIDEICV